MSLPRHNSLIFSPECRFYLARSTGPMSVELVDGCHGSPAGVAEAAKLHHRIFGAEEAWVMVELHEVPEWGAVPIDEESARICARAVQGKEPLA